MMSCQCLVTKNKHKHKNKELVRDTTEPTKLKQNIIQIPLVKSKNIGLDRGAIPGQFWLLL